MTGAIPPVCQAIWSSRDIVGEEYLATFKEAAHRIVSSEKGRPDAVLATRTSAGLVTTAQGARLEALEASDLVAIVDVDPVREVMMVRGPGGPSPWAALLFMVMRYREDSTGAVFVPTPTDETDEHGLDDTLQRPEKRTDTQETPEVKQRQESESAMETSRSRGWGFEEPTAQPRGGAATATGLVDWTAWGLKRLRNAPLAVSASGHLLSVGMDLHDAARAIDAIEGQSR